MLKNAFNPKKLVRNPYLSKSEGDGPATSFPDVERHYVSLCAQFGYVRYATASCIDGICTVKVGFATKEGAKK